MTDLADSRCATHPERPALHVCARCGAFSCASCTTLVSDEVHCVACHARLRATAVGFRATLALWLAVLSVCASVVCLSPVGLVLGVVALILASVERHAIEREEAPAGGLGRTIVATRLAWVGCAMAFLVLGLLFGTSLHLP